ncbi:hypothetical protein CHUAL_003882 [Chamberlinius hualienensis]
MVDGNVPHIVSFTSQQQLSERNVALNLKIHDNFYAELSGNSHTYLEETFVVKGNFYMQLLHFVCKTDMSKRFLFLTTNH